MKKKYLCLFVCTLVIVSAIPLTEAVDWWPKFRYDLKNTGYSSSLAPNQDHLVWTYETGNLIVDSPSVQDDKIFFGSADFKIYCLDTDKNEIWTYLTEGAIESSPAIANDRIYVGSGDGKLYCLDADPSDGEDEGFDDPENSDYDLIWKFSAGAPVTSSPAYSEDKIYVGASNSVFYCLDAINGDLIWDYTTGNKIQSSPSIANDRVFVGSNDKYVYCFDADPSDGEDEGFDDPENSDYDLIWLTQTGHNYLSSPAIANGKIYIGTIPVPEIQDQPRGKIYCLDASDGDKLWSFEPTGLIWTVATGVTSSPAVTNGKVYFCAIISNLVRAKHKVYCLDAINGEVIWEKTTVKGIKYFSTCDSSPAVADEKVYIGQNDGYIYCFDSSDGEEIWKYDTGNELFFFSSPAIADEKVYVGSIDKNLYCFGDPSPRPAPPTIDGPTNGKIGVKYTYTVTTTDPDGDDVSYQIYWGDGNYADWSGYVDSGEGVEFDHTWWKQGTFNIKARAKDIHVAVSNWGYLEVAMPFAAEIDMNSNTVVKGKSVQFNSQTYGGVSPYSYSWDFGDQSERSSAQNPSHTYTATNTYNVSLNVTDSGVNYSNVTALIEVVILKTNFSTNSSGYAQQNEMVYFNDTSDGYYNITSWYWDFGDGYNSTTRNTSHQFTTDGEYNVTLTVTDNQSNNNTFYQIIHVDSVSPEITHLYNLSDIVGFGYHVLFAVNVTDGSIGNETGVNSAKINISYPDQSYGNFTMDLDTDRTYLYLFNDTCQIGRYNYSIWTVDNSGNGKISSGGFNVSYCFGHGAPGNASQDVKDRIAGSVFYPIQGGVANNITVHIKANGSSSPIKSKCIIYRANDSALIGTTQEIVIDTDVQGEWTVYNFSNPKPVFSKDTGYVLTCWSNDSCNLSYDQSLVAFCSFYDNESYGNGTPPDPASWNNSGSILDFERRSYSIYCSYTPDNSTPEITSVSNTPDTVGFGFNVTIHTNVTDNQTSNDTGVKSVTVEITFPVSRFGNYTMQNSGGNTYEFVFNNTWQSGQYNYTIWAVDNAGNINSSLGHSFNVSGQATISVCTIKDNYGDNETVNLTDPPGIDPPLIGYELLDDGDVLHIWNLYDSYYFNTSSGIQLTNHKDDYWSHNVLMLGYYNNDQWNLIYRTDELSGFNKDIDTDNETYVNATMWKDLTYNGYDFRLAIRYHLGVDDGELTVIPYIKNLGQAIPYVLGFAWEINDIQVDMTPEDDYIEINGTSFYLNETVDVRFRNMTVPVYCWNETTNESYVCGYEPIPYFYVREDKPGNRSESLYLKWDESLDYVVRVKSRDGEYNAPVTLAFKIGTLDVGQEKYTELLWHDASEVTYYFDSYDLFGETWATNPGNMADGSTSNYASTPNPDDVELCNENTCEGSDLGTILKVELRAYGYYSISQWDIILRPVFDGENDGKDYTFETGDESGWSQWFDITNDNNAPEEWDWSDIRYLDCDVEAESGILEFTLYCSKVEVRVTYTAKPSVTYYFNHFNEEQAWEIHPEMMADGDSGTGAETQMKGRVEWLDGNNCTGTDIGTILKVEIRANGLYDWGAGENDIILIPVFEGENKGDEHVFDCGITPAWSSWFDITTDTNAPETWTWNDVSNLDCYVEADSDSEEFKLYCSKVEVRVTFTGDTDEETYFFVEEFESDWEYPEYMVDGDDESFAYAERDGFEQYCLLNTCEGEDLGTILKVELRTRGYRDGASANISLTPVFGGEVDGSELQFAAPEAEPAWSEWFDITDDENAPSSWRWDDIYALDCKVKAVGSGEFVLYCSKIEIRVSYTSPPNNAPQISNPCPADGSFGVSLMPTLNITVSDADTDTMNITWYSNSSGSWQVFGTNNSVGNGTYHQTFSNATVNGQWWYWKVNVTDGTNYTESSVYKFYTGCQSKITNTGPKDIKGYLLIQVQYYNTSNSTWVVVDDTINETNPRTLDDPSGEIGQNILALDTIFNGLVNTSNLSSFGNGTYRIYAAFRDPEGNILVTNDETELFATYEFTVTFE